MTPQQLEKFNSFLLQFARLSNSRNITPIYRGEKKATLYAKLGIPYKSGQTDNHRELLERLFMIGDKSKSYLSKEHFGLKRTWQFEINECDEGAYGYIFDTMCECIKKIKSKNVNTFFDNNTDFTTYFKNKAGNKEHFISTACLLPQEKKLAMRDYYLKLLHQIGSIHYRDRSNLTSTSRNYAEAKRFGGGSEAEGAVVIHAWEPVVAKFFTNKKYGLPVYKGRPFRSQQELSLLAGIFPHYIIGLEVLPERKMYINPNLFENRINGDTFFDGFAIDQRRFEVIIQQTNYDRYFIGDSNGYRDVEL